MLGLNKEYDPRSQKDIIFDLKENQRLQRDCKKYSDIVGLKCLEEEYKVLRTELTETRGF